MGTDAAIQAELRSIIDAALRGELTRAQADRANDLGRDATSAVMRIATETRAKPGKKIEDTEGWRGPPGRDG